MGYRLLLDENVEHEVMHRLEHLGHDVQHVELVGGLGKGTGDRSIGEYSLEENRLVLTYDDDFLFDFEADDHRGVLYLQITERSAREIADAIHAMSEIYPQDRITGYVYVDEWI